MRCGNFEWFGMIMRSKGSDSECLSFVVVDERFIRMVCSRTFRKLPSCLHMPHRPMDLRRFPCPLLTQTPATAYQHRHSKIHILILFHSHAKLASNSTTKRTRTIQVQSMKQTTTHHLQNRMNAPCDLRVEDDPLCGGGAVANARDCGGPRENDAGLPRVTRVTRKCKVFEKSISNTSFTTY